MTRAWLLLSVALFACGEDDDLVLSYFGSDANFVEAQAAAGEWSRVCGARVTVTRVPWHTPLVEVDDVRGATGDVENKGGATAREDGRVLSIQFKNTESAGRHLRHELGHALGREHTDGGIMAPSGPQDQKVEPSDC